MPSAAPPPRQTQQPISVEIHNETGVAAEGHATTRVNGEKVVLDIVLKAASRPGQFRDSMKSFMRS